MRRFLVHIGTFALLCLLVLFAVCFLLPFRVVGENEQQMVILDKLARLEATRKEREPRLILLGGSNLAFGIDSAEIERRTGFTVINAGIAAGQGLGYILKTVEPYFRDGDVIVLAAEYGHFLSGWNGSHERLIFMLDIHREPIWEMVQSGFLGWPKGWGNYVKWKFNRIVTPSDSWRTFGGRHQWNQYGDYLGHLGRDPVPFAVHEGRSTMGNLDPFALQALSNYVQRIERRYPRTQFLLSFPAVEQQSFEFYRPIVPLLIEKMQQIGFEVISLPEDYAFSYGSFYNSMWHLRAEPRMVRTSRLARDVQAWQLKQ